MWLYILSGIVIGLELLDHMVTLFDILRNCQAVFIYLLKSELKVNFKPSINMASF